MSPPESSTFSTEELDEIILRLERDSDLYGHLMEQDFSLEDTELSGDTDRAKEELGNALRVLENTELLKDGEAVDSAVKELYRAALAESQAMIELLEAKDTGEGFREASRKLWGEPEKRYYGDALDILENGYSDGEVVESFSEKEYQTSFTGEELADNFRKVFDHLDVDWDVELYDGDGIVSVSSMNEKVMLPADREFSHLEALRLEVHELGQHMVSNLNGLRQDYRVLGRGVGKVEEFDEGMAVMLEQNAGLLDEETMKKYAARFVAVYEMNQGTKEEQVGELLRSYELEEEMIDRILERAYNEGGNSRDHLYFQGFRKLEEYLDEGGELENLMIGKAPIEHLKALKDLEEIEAPKYSPAELPFPYHHRQ